MPGLHSDSRFRLCKDSDPGVYDTSRQVVRGGTSGRHHQATGDQVHRAKLVNCTANTAALNTSGVSQRVASNCSSRDVTQQLHRILYPI